MKLICDLGLYFEGSKYSNEKWAGLQFPTSSCCCFFNAYCVQINQSFIIFTHNICGNTFSMLSLLIIQFVEGQSMSIKYWISFFIFLFPILIFSLWSNDTTIPGVIEILKIKSSFEKSITILNRTSNQLKTADAAVPTGDLDLRHAY